MQRFIFSVLSVLLLFVFANNITSAQQWSNAQKDVWAGVEKYWEASSSNNVAEFLKYFDDSYLGWNNVSPVPMDKANVSKWIKQGAMTSSTVMYTLNPLAIWVKGDFAYVHYYYAEVDKNKETGKMENNTGKWTDILMKKDGTWVLIGDHGGRTSKPNN